MCLSAPDLPKDTLRQLLEICNKESPFKHIDGSIYKQRDGVTMGAPSVVPLLIIIYLISKMTCLLQL